MTTNDSIPFAHWYHLVEGLQESTQKFYTLTEEAVLKRKIPKVKLSRIDYRIGGIFSVKREYLRVIWKPYSFDICAAPFGTGFFVSWWLGESPTPFRALIFSIPFIGPLLVRTFKPITYYQMDTALMFEESVHAAVLEVLDSILQGTGVRALTEFERKPIMQDLVQK